MVQNSLLGAGARSPLKGLKLAAVLLTVFALSPGFYVPEMSTADAAVVRATPVPVSAKAASVPAVKAPATTLFAKGVPGLSPEVLRMALDRVACARSAG